MGGEAVTRAPTARRVSVIVPTRNRDRFLREALTSVQANRRPGLDIEVIVVDNGGGDETGAIAAQAGAQYARCPNAGAAAARNHGIRLASGDYVAFLDDDDVWTPGHLSARVDWLDEHPDFGAVLGQVCNVDPDLGVSGRPWPEALPANGSVFRALLRIQPQVGATLVRRSALETVGPFDETLISDEDWDWHLRLALGERVGFVPVVCVLFRARPTGTDDELQWVRFPFLREVFWRNVRRGGRRSPSLPSVLRTYLHHLGAWHGGFLSSAKAHARQGRTPSARKVLGYAARVSPLHLVWSLMNDSEARRTATAALLPSAMGWRAARGSDVRGVEGGSDE
jgi:glycosyltransferase involved in cell wall biosynthesis